MNKTVDFEKVRKKRQRAHRLRQMLILAGIVGLVFAAVFINNLLIEQNVTTRVSDVIGSFGGTGYPVDLPGGVIRGVKNMGANLAVLNDTNLHIYNKNGKQIQNIQQMTGNTVFDVSDERTLTYDVGSRKFSVYTPGKLLYSQETSDSIMTADMGAGGEIAVVISPRQYVAQVTVYNKRMAPVFNWYSADNIVADVSLSPRGDMAAIGCLNAQDGIIKSIISLCRFNSKEEAAKIEIHDNMLLHIDFQTDKRIALITDKQYLIYGNDGVKLYEYQFSESQPAGFETLGNHTLLLLESRESRTQELVLLDAECKPVASMTSEKRILDMALGQREIYLLSEDGISVYNHKFEQKSSFEERGIQSIHLAKSKLYYLTREEICLLESGK